MSSPLIESDAKPVQPGQSRLWLVRMPGGPLRAVKSVKQNLSSEQAKAAYKKSITFISTEADIDPELKWPELRPIDQMTLEQRYPFLLEISDVTKKPRGLVEC